MIFRDGLKNLNPGLSDYKSERAESFIQKTEADREI